MCRGNVRTSRTIVSKGSAGRAIRVLIRNRFFVPKTGRERMFSFGKEGAGFYLTATSRTDTFVFRATDLSGAGRRHHMLLRCHAGTKEVTDGAGELRSVTAMMVDCEIRAISTFIRWIRHPADRNLDAKRRSRSRC